MLPRGARNLAGNAQAQERSAAEPGDGNVTAKEPRDSGIEEPEVAAEAGTLRHLLGRPRRFAHCPRLPDFDDVDCGFGAAVRAGCCALESFRSAATECGSFFFAEKSGMSRSPLCRIEAS